MAIENLRIITFNMNLFSPAGWCVFVCVCVRKRERGRERKYEIIFEQLNGSLGGN